MPQCSCGCNQTLSQQQIQRHLWKHVVPHLIAVAVAQFQTLGRSVSAPRLNLATKKWTSQQYLPSSLSPEPSNDNEIMVDQSLDGSQNMVVNPEEVSNVEELSLLRSIGRAQQGVWSGQRVTVEYEGEVSKGDNNHGDDAGEDENREGSVDEDNRYWEEYDHLENPTGLSALDLIGEDFECSAAANDESLSTNGNAN